MRTSLPATALGAEDAVRTYKRLSHVARAFRSFKTVDLRVRPIFHDREERVRAHVLLCLLAYYVEWRMRQTLAPLLFAVDDPAGAEAQRSSPVAPAQPSPSARGKARTKHPQDGQRLPSFQTLLEDLATIVQNHIQPHLEGGEPFDMLTRPTALQSRALDLLGVSLKCTQ